MLQAPTGSGKTRLAAEVVRGARRKGNRVVFSVPALELIDQTVAAFRAAGIVDIGVIQANHPLTNPAAPVQVASVQTLGRRGLPDTDVVVVDEAHRGFKVIHDWMKKADCPFIGLSATPWTKGLGKHYDDLIVAATTKQLIADGFLSPFKVFAAGHPDLRGVRTVAGDYHEGDLARAMNVDHIGSEIVATWVRMARTRPTLAFAVDKAHARSLEYQFDAAGVSAAYVDDETPRPEREAIRAAFEARDVQVVVNIGVLTTGVDWDVRCVILARPTQSEALYVQIIGRGLRRAEGKDFCLILDHSDTTKRLGFVDDIHHDHLDDGQSRRKVDGKLGVADKRTPRECPRCGFLVSRSALRCPECDAHLRDAPPAPVKKKRDEPKATSDLSLELQRWWAGLLWLAENRRYRKGWASRTFAEKFGFVPLGLHDRPAKPADDIRDFVAAKHARFAAAHLAQPAVRDQRS